MLFLCFILDSVWIPLLLDFFFPLNFFFFFFKEDSVDSRLNSFESQMSVQWKLKVDRQMVSVRSTRVAKTEDGAQGKGDKEVVPSPWCAQGILEMGGAGWKAPVCTHPKDVLTTQQLWSRLVICPSLPTAEILLPSGFLKELWKGLYWQKFNHRHVMLKFSLKKPSSGNIQVVFHLTQNGISSTLKQLKTCTASMRRPKDKITNLILIHFISKSLILQTSVLQLRFLLGGSRSGLGPYSDVLGLSTL